MQGLGISKSVLLCCVLLLSSVWGKDAVHAPKREETSPVDRQIVELGVEYMHNGTEYRGVVEIALFNRQFPRTVENFKQFCRGTDVSVHGETKHVSYVGVPFHRIEEGFVVQGGDVLLQNGYGSVSAVGKDNGHFENEEDQLSSEAFADGAYVRRLHDSEGTVAMANSGRDRNGSQFYITLGPTTEGDRRGFSYLDGNYTVFGKVISGMEVIREIVKRNTEAKEKGGQPLKPTISRATVTSRTATEKMVSRYALPADAETKYFSEEKEEHLPQDNSMAVEL
ncbi:hypothetical protein NECID01_0469 [Nematocida sp. AWRm77]|nr:hypothetical protein NECID01_0469 [Nematocida sp. AWRm77]